MSLLGNKQLRKLILRDGQIVSGLRRKNLRDSDAAIQPASIDLTVGRVIIPPSDRQFPRVVSEVRDFYLLPRGGSVVVELHEEITLPADIGGILLPKNGHFASKALLITNFGHVDPGFHGFLKCTVINFGHDEYMLEAGTPIACLLLFKLDENSYPDWSTSNRHGQETIETHAKVLGRYFLDFPVEVEAVASRTVSRMLQSHDRFAFWAPIFTIIVGLAGIGAAIFIYLASYLTSWNDRWFTLHTSMSELRHELDTVKKGSAPVPGGP